jgi:hypothetical protein
MGEIPKPPPEPEQNPEPMPKSDEPWWIKFPWADSIEEVWEEIDDHIKDEG